MNFKPLPPYFIVRINIEKQRERKEKIGSLYLHSSHVAMERNVQCGEIIAIGTKAAKDFPQAKLYDTLILHHFVEKSYLLCSNEIDNFYTVTASECQGRRNESYGIISNGEIIPHPDFVFIEPEIKSKEVSTEDFIKQNTKQVGSLILFNNWEETREEKENKAKELVAEIKNQSKGKSIKDDVKIALENKQLEAEQITQSINKKQYQKYKVAFAPPSLKTNEYVYALNVAAQLFLEVNGKEYTVIATKYCVCTTD